MKSLSEGGVLAVGEAFDDLVVPSSFSRGEDVDVLSGDAVVDLKGPSLLTSSLDSDGAFVAVNFDFTGLSVCT